MSGADKVAEYDISANPAGFTAGMEKAQAAAKQAAQDIKSSLAAIEGQMSALSGALKSITSVFGTLTAVIAGGAAFKEVIGQANAWTGEAKKLSAQLGITTERASVMMVAMRHLGIDSEVVTMAAGKMAKQIATNGQAFEKMGVSVKDSAGQYRPTLDIMGEVNSKLKEIRNPIEQNIAGTQIYGKSWNEVRGTLRLTTEEIKAAEQKTKDLGLVVGEEGVANAKKYKESINDMKLVMTSLEVQTGNALLPTFVRLGSWLSGIGPTTGKAFGMVLDSLAEIISMLAEVVLDLWNLMKDGFSGIGDLIGEIFGTKAPSAMEFFGNVLKVVEIAFLGFKVAVQLAIEAVIGYIDYAVTHMMRMASVAERALHGDFSGAKQAWATGTAILEDVQRKHFDKLVQIASNGKDKLDEIIMRQPKPGPDIKDKEIKGGPTYEFGKDKDDKAKSRVHEWDAKLAADKDGYAKEQAMAGTAMEFSQAMERDYWKRILDTTTMSKEEKAQVERKYYASMAAIRKEDFENEIAGEKLKLDEFKNNHLARLEIANRMYQENVARFGAEAKEAKAALAEVYKEQRAFADQTRATNKVVAEARRNADLAAIDAAQQDAEQQLALRHITVEQMLELERGFEAKRYQIRMQALMDQKAMMQGPDKDPIALAQIQAQIEALEQQHQTKLTAIKNKATLEQNKSMQGLYSNMQSGLASVIAGTAKGTMTMSQALQGMMQTVTGSVIDMLAQSAAQWLMNLMLTETSSKATAVGEIASNAGIAGAAATASAAAIPLVGWMLAPEAGLAASAAAMAYMPMASASGGYDIPAGLNPIVQTHAEEMILPAKHANVIRDMADNGAGGGGPTINYHDHSGRLTPQEIRRNAGVIQKALMDHAKKT
jgi:hypothetical protein